MVLPLRMAGTVAGAVLVLIVSFFWGATDASSADESAQPFGFEAVARRAEELAGKPYERPSETTPNWLQNLSYDDVRKIRYRADRAIWRNERLFEVQLFHLGFLYRVPVRLNIVENDQVVSLPFRREMFDYGDIKLENELPDDLGFAGFRIHYPLHTPEYKDEIAVFLGASYFRILGREQRFGSSARGLAVDTAQPSGEEFPYFREFWLMAPGEHDTRLTLFALLDSQSVTGAFEFRIEPGTETIVEVASRIFCREPIDKLGVAPLTSMFFFGENASRRVDDYRPEVHDADGLLIHNGKREWIWRPLTNPAALRVSAFVDNNPRGFGLMQRDRDFGNYLDLGARFGNRPSMWVEPVGDWGQGSVELIEIPTADETNDNIVAFWVPNRQINAGETLNFRYRLYAHLANVYRPPLAQTLRTRVGSPEVPGTKEDQFPPQTRLFVVDFHGGDLKYLSPQQPVEAVIIHSSGRVFDKLVVHNEMTNGWRVMFRFDPQGTDAADLKMFLTFRGNPITESWSFLWTPSLADR